MPSIPSLLSIQAQDLVRRDVGVRLNISGRVHLRRLQCVEKGNNLRRNKVQEYEINRTVSGRDSGGRDERHWGPDEVWAVEEGQGRVDGVVADAWAGLRTTQDCQHKILRQGRGRSWLTSEVTYPRVRFCAARFSIPPFLLSISSNHLR